MNEPLNTTVVFTVIGLALSGFMLSWVYELSLNREHWSGSDLAKKFLFGFLSLLAVAGLAILIHPEAKLDNLEPYPFIKILGFATFMSLYYSLKIAVKRLPNVE